MGMITGVSIDVVNELYEQYGDEYYFVGQPTEGTSGNYVKSEGVLVVNRNSSNLPAIQAYLECLLSDEIQLDGRSLGKLSVKKVSEEEVEFIERNNKTEAIWNGKSLVIKADGTTTLTDYIEFLESCVPYPTEYREIIDIVWEEAQGYIDGDKSAEKVAEVIDNRVQLYLDERK